MFIGTGCTIVMQMKGRHTKVPSGGNHMKRSHSREETLKVIYELKIGLQQESQRSQKSIANFNLE